MVCLVGILDIGNADPVENFDQERVNLKKNTINYSTYVLFLTL